MLARLIIVLLVGIHFALDSVQSVAASNQTVSKPANLTIVLSLTSTASTIKFVLPIDYTVHTNLCFVQSMAAACTLTNTSTQRTLSFSGSFSSLQTFQFQVINPLYESYFDMFSYNGAAMIGGGSVVLQTLAFQSTCSLVSNSSIVAASATGKFSMSVLSVPAGSVVYLTFQKQTIFQDILTSIASVSCSSPTTAGVSCQLSNSDTTTYTIQVTGLFPADTASGTVSLTLSPMNNPPYNDTFSSIGLQITDQNSNRIAYCSCQQQAPTVLASSSILYDGWNSAINQQSTVSFRLIPKTALPAGFQLLLVYPLGLVLQAAPPAIQTVSSNATTTKLWLSNLTMSSGRVSFNATAKNPSSVKALPMTVYAVYTSTQFIEVVSVSNLTLTIASISLNASLANSQVMSNTTLTLTGNFTDPILNGYLTLTIDRGSFLCTVSATVNGATVVQSSCNATQLVLQCSAQNLTSVAVGYATPLSVQNATVQLNSSSSTNDSISYGKTQLAFSPATIQFTVASSNLVFGGRTTVTLLEMNSTSVGQQRRIFTVTAPSNMNLTGLVASGAALNSFTANTTTNVLTVDYNGSLNLSIANIQNPTLYDGNRSWSIVTTDALGYAVSSGSSQQSSEYAPATASISVRLGNTIIEQNTTATISLKESLQHLPTDYLLVRIPNATIVAPCPGSNCTLSNGAIRFAYASSLTFNSSVTSAAAPGNYPCSIEYYTSAGVLLENGTSTYQLTAMIYTFNSSFSGFMGQEGLLDLNLTTRPGTDLQLTYSVGSVLQNSACRNCSNARLLLTGLVVFFTTVNVTVTGAVGNVVYATGTTSISYPCAPGCHVCTSTACTQCFDSNYTTLVYFYNGTCMSSCPIATYATGTSCIDCQRNCYGCNASGCQVCSSGYYLYNRQCVASCPDGYAVVGGQCVVRPIQCSAGCVSCISITSCQRCSDAYVLFQQQCYTSCPGSLVMQKGTCVEPPVPPVASSTFPFPFAVTAVSIFVILLCFKCFDKRSMILGNFISLFTLLELGSLLMFLTLLLLDKHDLVNQLLTYLCVLSKVACNLFMLLYFLKKISRDEKFEEWLAVDAGRSHLKNFVMVMAALVSFQFYRFLYSRLLGLEVFFARFSSPLMLKPLSYLNYAYAIVTSGSLITLAIISIIRQHEVHTVLFWASVEIMFMELILFLVCVIDDGKKTDEHFDYQIYKIENEFEAGVPDVKEESMSELGGNFFQPLQAGTLNEIGGNTSDANLSQQDDNKGSGLKNIFEMDSKEESGSESQDQKKDNNAQTGNNSLQQEEQDQHNSQLPLSHHYSHRSIFRKRTIDEWNNFKAGKNRSGVVVGTNGRNKSLSPSRSQAQLKTAKSHSNDRALADESSASVAEGQGQGANKSKRLIKPLSHPKLDPNDNEEDKSHPVSQSKVWNEANSGRNFFGRQNILSVLPPDQLAERDPRSPNNLTDDPIRASQPSAIGRGSESTNNLRSERSPNQRSYYRINLHRNNLEELNKDQTEKDIMEQLGGEEPLTANDHERNMLERQLEESIKVVEDQGLEAIAPQTKDNGDEDIYEPFFGGSREHIERAIDGRNQDNDQREQEHNEDHGQKPVSPDLYETSSAIKLEENNPDEYGEFTQRRQRKKKKKAKPASRYRNTSIEEIYLQRLSASVSKPTRKPDVEREF